MRRTHQLLSSRKQPTIKAQRVACFVQTGNLGGTAGKNPSTPRPRRKKKNPVPRVCYFDKFLRWGFCYSVGAKSNVQLIIKLIIGNVGTIILTLNPHLSHLEATLSLWQNSIDRRCSPRCFLNSPTISISSPH